MSGFICRACNARVCAKNNAVGKPLPLAHNLQLLHTLSASLGHQLLHHQFQPHLHVIRLYMVSLKMQMSSGDCNRGRRPGGVNEKKQKCKKKRKAHTKTETQTWNLCQGFRDWNLLLPSRYIENKAGFVMKIIHISSNSWYLPCKILVLKNLIDKYQKCLQIGFSYQLGVLLCYITNFVYL